MLKNPDNILITGGSGIIGGYLNFGIKPGSAELDITDGLAVTTFISNYKPKIIIHLAALTDQIACETNTKNAEHINVKGTENLAREAGKHDSLFVFVSTNAVFDGTKKTPYLENDTPNPINNYGKTKLEAEQEVIKHCKNWLIARTSWIYGGGRKDKRFVSKIIDQLISPKIKALDDNFGTPTYAKDFATKLMELIKNNQKGLFHLANAGVATRLDQAKVITDHFKYRGKLIPCSIDSLKLPYKNPKNEALASKTISLRPWQEALKEYLIENFQDGQ